MKSSYGVSIVTINALALSVLGICMPLYAEDYFNLSVLETDTPLENSGALAEFLKNNELSPGRYITTIIWDQDRLDKREINFILSPDKKKIIPQFTKGELRSLGVKVDDISGLKDLDDEQIADDISLYIPEASYDFRTESQILFLRIPQIFRDAQAAQDIDPKYWDDGVAALWSSYYVSGSRQHTDSGRTDSTWGSLNSGINVGPWRLRNNSSWGQEQGWQSISTTLQRDIKKLRSQLELGQTYTDGQLFDSIQMTGIKLQTDTSMLPNSLQGFAPVVRGIANSDAQVSIKQNGYIIYQTYVSAGPFEIHDLSQVTAGSDLEVTVKETDGSERTFIQASSSVPVMQREGALNYSLAAGKYRAQNSEEEPQFGQVTAMYGMPYGVTAYGGVLGATMYRSGLIGIGADLQSFGSVSMDVTMARSTFKDGRDSSQGTSWRAQYAKDFPMTDTTVTLASYRYSTSGFYTFQEAIDQRNNDNDDDGVYAYRNDNNRRSRLQINISQPVGGWGSVYANAYQQDYWGLDGHERSVSLGYSTNWCKASWSVNYSLTKTPMSDSDRQVSLNVNIPLSGLLANSWATYSVNSTQHGNTSHQVGLNGTLLDDNNLSYNLQQSYTDNNVGYGSYLSGRYRNSIGEFGAGYSYSRNSKQWNYSAQGSIVAHADGVTLGQSLQDSFAIIHIENGENVQVKNSRGVVTDSWGNAIAPMLTNYRRNPITVNTKGHEDLDIQDASLDVIPTRGAAVKAKFVARVGKRLVLTLRHGAGVVPFGAIMSIDGTTSIVGDSGEVYLTGMKGVQPFTVQWGSSSEQQCSGKVSVSEKSKQQLQFATVNCQ